MLETCEECRIDFLFIAGDLFHRQPLKRELKEVNYLFSKLSVTKVVFIAGNHDYLREDSYYKTFPWEGNVYPIFSPQLSCVEFPEYSLAVYGLSYHEKEITQELYKDCISRRNQPYEILLAHGGDEKHIPVKKEDLLGLGYDYIAMGHIHKPQQICPGKIAYAGALEPIDKNDTGMHGYILGEITVKGCQTKFVPAASREYIHMEVPVTKKMTGNELWDGIREMIRAKGEENIYKLILTGPRDAENIFDLSRLEECGNIIEISDRTFPAYDFQKLKEQNRENILGQFIASLENSAEGSMEYLTLCEGVQALMETRRG